MWWHNLWEAEVPVVDPNSTALKTPVWGSTITGLFNPVDQDETAVAQDKARRIALKQKRAGEGANRPRTPDGTHRTPQGQKPMEGQNRAARRKSISPDQFHQSPARPRCRSADRARRGKPAKPQGVQRPQSAVALLRGSGLTQKAHEDEFLQGIENGEVHRELEGLKAKALQQKDFVDSFDILQDTYLFDLKVLHNMDARTKQPVPKTQQPTGTRKTPQTARGKKQLNAWEDLSASERLKKLRTVLETSVRSGTRVSVMRAKKVDPFNVSNQLDPTTPSAAAEHSPDWSGGRDLRSGGSKEPQGPDASPARTEASTATTTRQTIRDVRREKHLKPGEKSGFDNIFNLAFQMPDAKSVTDEEEKKKHVASESGQLAGFEPPPPVVPLRLVVELVDFLLTNFGSMQYAWERIDMHKTGRLSCLQWSKNLRKIGFTGDTKKGFAFLADDLDCAGEISLVHFDRFEPVIELYLKDIQHKQEIMEARVDKIQDTPTMPQLQYSALTASRMHEPELKLAQNDAEERHMQVVRQRKAAMPFVLSPSERIRAPISFAEARQRAQEHAMREQMKQQAVKQDFQQIFKTWHTRKFLQYEDEMSKYVDDQVQKQVEAVQRAKDRDDRSSPRERKDAKAQPASRARAGGNLK